MLYHVLARAQCRFWRTPDATKYAGQAHFHAFSDFPNVHQRHILEGSQRRVIAQNLWD